MINSKKIMHFVGVAKAGNFNDAARQLHISQPALSRSIQSLEQSLNVTLFDRSQRVIKLTKDGFHLLKHAHSVMQDLENFVIESKRLTQLEAGSLTVGTGPLPADHVGAQACADFLIQHPDVQLTLTVDEPANLVKKLVQGEIDILIADPRGLDSVENLHFAHLSKFPTLAVARANHPLSTKHSLTAEDITQFPLASISKAASRFFMDHLGVADNGGNRFFNYHCNSVQLMLTTLKHSDLIGILLSCNVIKELEREELCILDVPAINHRIYSDYAIITYQPRLLSLAAEAFIEICKELIASN